jgi:CubicO group peptidase (beta-lactamase class C family)
MNRLLLTACWIALCTLPLPGAAAAPAPALNASRIDAVFKDYGPTTPGCALGLYRQGQILYAKGYGMADLDLKVPITPQTMFDVGSTSKQFTAASIVLLANQGKLALADDVRKYLPELPDYGATLTIEHLLRHTSGLRDYDGLLYIGGHYFEDYTNDDDALKIIVAQRRLNFTPGAEWDYSNTGFFLAALIVQRVTGQSLAAYAKAQLLDPLGMQATHFRTDHTAILPRRAVAYAPRPNGGYAIDMSNWDQIGDGGINTNVLELARWDANFYDGKVGGRRLIDALTEPGTLADGKSHSYGRGLFLDTYRGLARVHHGGAWAGYRAMLMRFPEQRLSIGLTCNVGNADTQRRAESVADVVLERAFAPAPAATPSADAPQGAAGAFDASPYLGTYYDANEQQVLEIAREDAQPVAKIYGRAFPLTRAAPDRLVAASAHASLEFDADRAALRLLARGAARGPFKRVVPPTLTLADRAEIAGKYHSAELDATWTVRVDGDRTILGGRAIGESDLKVVQKDGYATPDSYFAFTRDARGAIDGFELSAGRMRKIRFDR